MSAWGNTDNTTIAGTVTVYAANVNVVGSSTYFTVNVKAGDYLTVSGQGKYQIADVTSNIALTLTTIPTAAAAGKVAFLQQGPKYKFTNNTMPVARQSNTVSIQTIYGVDSTEIASANLKSNASHTGWVSYTTYTDAYGAVRKKTEVLVAMSKNGITQDDENTVFPNA